MLTAGGLQSSAVQVLGTVTPSLAMGGRSPVGGGQMFDLDVQIRKGCPQLAKHAAVALRTWSLSGGAVLDVRLDQAAFLLRTTQRSPESVAFAVGCKNASTLRALVRRRRGITLTELKRGHR